MKWEKLGLVYGARGETDWQHSHAYIPTPVAFGDYIRVFVSFWDKNQIGRVGWVDVDIEDPTKVLWVSDKPSLDIGSYGQFDCKGVTPMSCINVKGSLYMLYTGWGNHKDYPYTLLTGLAVSEDNGLTFTRSFKSPLLEPVVDEETIRTAAWVHYEEEIDEYWIWYVGGDEWFYADNKLTPTYDLRLVRSTNLFDFSHQKGALVMSADITRNEYAIGRPCVIKENGLYHLYYSSRRYNHGYRLGYATSTNGYEWDRRDEELGISLSQIGWDSQMQCFSYVLPTKYGTYLFYNGNEHGKAGFGVARKYD